jgi:ketosteroid isomerase-like protein
VQAAYVKAWLADDTAGVLATLDPDAILLPPGRLPVAGQEAIRAFWWPTDGSHTTIKQFTWQLAELAGASDLAYSRGTSNLSWRYENDTTRSEQTSRNLSLTVFVRSEDGKWRILRQMWGPSLPG